MPYLTLTEKSNATTKPWVASYHIRPGNGVGLFWATKHTLTHTYLPCDDKKTANAGVGCPIKHNSQYRFNVKRLRLKVTKPHQYETKHKCVVTNKQIIIINITIIIIIFVYYYQLTRTMIYMSKQYKPIRWLYSHRGQMTLSW